ncbi:MAG: ribosome silencing factor [Bacteroidota bacterium]
MAKKKKENPGKLIDTIVKGIQEKKGNNIVCLDMTELKNAVTDYFVICDADNMRQVKAIADSIEEMAQKKAGEKPWHVEGEGNANWVLLDYVNVVAHVFHKEARDFYNLESLWADAKRTEFEN